MATVIRVPRDPRMEVLGEGLTGIGQYAGAQTAKAWQGDSEEEKFLNALAGAGSRDEAMKIAQDPQGHGFNVTYEDREDIASVRDAIETFHPVQRAESDLITMYTQGGQEVKATVPGGMTAEQVAKKRGYTLKKPRQQRDYQPFVDKESGEQIGEFRSIKEARKKNPNAVTQDYYFKQQRNKRAGSGSGDKQYLSAARGLLRGWDMPINQQTLDRAVMVQDQINNVEGGLDRMFSDKLGEQGIVFAEENKPLWRKSKQEVMRRAVVEGKPLSTAMNEVVELINSGEFGAAVPETKKSPKPTKEEPKKGTAEKMGEYINQKVEDYGVGRKVDLGPSGDLGGGPSREEVFGSGQQQRSGQQQQPRQQQPQQGQQQQQQQQQEEQVYLGEGDKGPIRVPKNLVPQSEEDSVEPLIKHLQDNQGMSREQAIDWITNESVLGG